MLSMINFILFALFSLSTLSDPEHAPENWIQQTALDLRPYRYKFFLITCGVNLATLLVQFVMA